MKNIPLEFSIRRVRLCSIAAAAAGFRPCPARAADSPSASAIAFPATSSDRFAARNPTTRRGAISLAV